MYTLGALLLLAVLLGIVVSVVDSVLGAIGVSDTIKQLPVIGAHWSLIISILLVWACKLDPILGWNIEFEKDWMTYVANGAIIYGMIPVKDAVVNMVNKGLRA